MKEIEGLDEYFQRKLIVVLWKKVKHKRKNASVDAKVNSKIQE